MFGEVLKSLRKQNKMSMDSLVEKYNAMFNAKLNKSTLSRYERGLQKPSFTVVLNFAKLFNVSLDLLTSNKNANFTRSYKAVYIPVLENMITRDAIEALSNIVEYVDIPEEIAKKDFYYGLRMKGNAMEPRICDGDIVVAKKQDWVDDDQIAVVVVNGYDATCKKVKYSEKGITLLSLNPRYEPLFFAKGPANNIPVKILGLVVEVRRKV